MENRGLISGNKIRNRGTSYIFLFNLLGQMRMGTSGTGRGLFQKDVPCGKTVKSMDAGLSGTREQENHIGIWIIRKIGAGVRVIYAYREYRDFWFHVPGTRRRLMA